MDHEAGLDSETDSPTDGLDPVGVEDDDSDLGDAAVGSGISDCAGMICGRP